MGTRIRLNRRDRPAGIRRCGFGVTGVWIGGSSRFFTLQCCREYQRYAPQELLNTPRFLFSESKQGDARGPTYWDTRRFQSAGESM